MTTGVALVSNTISRRSDVVPERAEFSRYQPLLDRSAFAVATSTGLAAATSIFPKDLYIASMVHSPEGDLVTLASASDKNFKECLTTKSPNSHGYRIIKFKWPETSKGKDEIKNH
jgi:hypothetical protein